MRYSDYMDSVLRDLWTWADEHHRAELDGGKRQGRPPVLATEFSSMGVLVPPNASIAQAIQAAIPKSQRHRWFRSLKSSQALSQSVFGAVDGVGEGTDAVASVRRSSSHRPAPSP